MDNSNLSQIKRNEMLQFLKTIKKEHTDDESIKAINEIENFILDKKYGLLWEEHEENLDIQIRENIPVFTECVDKKITKAPDENYNFILEGDNLQSLRLLEKTHAGRIDVIYIDPPYNRGNDDFIYDDRYIDKEDGYRHSKWLSFMEERMRIAYDLLSEDGILFVSIDDNEQAELKMLLDEIFTENNFIIEMPRITKKSGKTTGSFAKNHDYVLVYIKHNSDIFAMEEHNDPNYSHTDEYVAERGKYKLNQTLDYDSLQYSSNLDYPITIDGEVFYPGGDKKAWEARQSGNHRRSDWIWRWQQSLFEFGYKNGFIEIKRKEDGTARIYTKTYLNATIKKDKHGGYYIEYIDRTKPMSSIELVNNIYSNDRAKKDLAVFGLEDDFDYSKPVELIKRLIKNYRNKDAIVLDFFAGSGTTAQAVLELNVEDGGHRKFILCTNNQNNICEKITYKRCKDVITSYPYKCEEKTELLCHEIKISDFNDREHSIEENEGTGKQQSVMDEIKGIKKEYKGVYNRFSTEIKDKYLYLYGIKTHEDMCGIPANLKYFKCDWVPRNPSDYYLSDALCHHIKEMIELQEGVEIDNKREVLVINEDDFHRFVMDNKDYKQIENIWINQNIIFNGEESEFLETLNNVKYIPKKFFGQELKEVAE